MTRPLPHIEILYDGAWHEVTRDVYSSEHEITTARGRGNWAAVSDPSEMVVPFRQHESKYATAPGGGRMVGRYAPRNPRSDLYGKIGRNTPIRLRLGEPAPRLRLPGTVDAAATTPDAAALRLTGDQRVEILVRPASWRKLDGAALARRYLTTGNQRAWAWWINGSGTLSWRYSVDGSAIVTRESNGTVPDDVPERWIAVWHDVNNGAGGNVLGFETSLDGVTWDPVGTPQTFAGTIAFHPAQAPFEVGRTAAADVAGVAIPPMAGRIGALRYRSGILPTSPLVVDVDFRVLDTHDRAATDTAGRVWTLTDAAYISDSSIRLAGEAATWPQDVGQVKAGPRSAPVTVAGALRRAQRNQAPLQSSLRRDLSTKANVVRYYPLEERSGAAQYASGLAGDSSTLTPTDAGEVKAAANGDAFVASDPLPTFAAGELSGTIPAYVANASQRLIWLSAVPEAGISTDRHLMRAYTPGSLARWEVVYGVGGTLRFRCYDDDGNAIFLHGPSASSLDGRPMMMSLWLEQQSPTTTFFQLAYFPVGAGAFVADEGTVAGTYARFARLQLGTTVGLEGTVMGHVAILNGDVHNVWDTASQSLDGWAGEAGADRLLRLGADTGFPVRLTGEGQTPAMGPQRSRTFIDLAREVPATDLGILGDSTEEAGALAYRPARSMTGQSPALTIPYRLFVPPPKPTDDDEGTANRITVKSAGGVELTVEDTTSSMSTAPPPAGVGLYDQSTDINAEHAVDAETNAWWRLAMGTVDASRWPDLDLVLDRSDMEPYVDAVLGLEPGDLVRITDLPEGVPPGPVDLIVNAIGDRITRAKHIVRLTCGPAHPWIATGTWAAAGVAGADVARWDGAGSVLAAAVDASQTTMSVTYGVTSWTTTPAHFPFDVMVGGERMTVTAISAPSGTTQTFTVTRGVTLNHTGVAHDAGTTVHLADPTVWSL